MLFSIPNYTIWHAFTRKTLYLFHYSPNITSFLNFGRPQIYKNPTTDQAVAFFRSKYLTIWAMPNHKYHQISSLFVNTMLLHPIYLSSLRHFDTFYYALDLLHDFSYFLTKNDQRRADFPF